MADDTAADLSPDTAAEIPAEPTAEPATQPAAESAAESAAEPPAQPAVEPVAQPPVELAVEPPALDTTVVAATIEVPPLATTPAAAAPAGEGGEWELLTGQVRAWLESGQLQKLWAQARTPVTALAALIALLVVLRVYSALLGAIESLPLVPGLLELVGVIWLVRKGVPKLVRNSEREQLISGLRQRWQSFLGRG
jgi:hypothetical protein